MNGERIIVICAILSSQIYSLTCIGSHYPRDSPISILSNYVKPVNLPPLQILRLESDQLLLNNTGYELLFTLNQKETSSILTGGTLFNNKYTFSRILFIWNGYWGASCSHEIDGRGAPIEVAVIYTNDDYKTFENCLSHSDGLAILAIPVFVDGHIDNPLFNPLGKAIQKLINPNSKSIRTTAGGDLLNLFYYQENVTLTTYYSYPGSYIDLRTNKLSHCATVILVPDLFSISIDQFQNSFLLLQSANGSPLGRPLTVFDAGNRPVLQANGTIMTVKP